MKFSVIKTVVAASALAVASVAGAAAGDNFKVTAGSGTLKFSSEGLGALAVVGVTVVPLSGSATTGSTSAGFTQPLTLLTSGTTNLSIGQDANIAGAGVTSLTFGTAGVQLQKLADGSNVASLSNFSFDVASKTLYGDVKIGTAATATRYALYTAATLEGSTLIPTALGTQTVTNKVGYDTDGSGPIAGNNLRLGSSFADAIGAYLGLSTPIVEFTKSVNFGTLDSSITGTVAAVPEPSTYGLMGLGLAGAAFVARRRKAA